MSVFLFDPVKILKFSDQTQFQIPAWIKSIQNTILDLEFFELIKNISASLSREEEERIICAELQNLKSSFAQQDKPSSKKRECLIRMLYCHMLGYDVPFGYVHALNMTQDSKLLNKRTGYLALSLCLPPKHELLIMVVNSVMKDLKSTNFLEVTSALTALARLVDRETIPAFIPRVIDLLKTSNRPIVRKKCVVALHRFYSVDSSLFDRHLHDSVRMALSDKDPSVMAAAISMFLDISKSEQAPSIADLVPSFGSILKQVAEGRLPRHYLYHGVPNPWLQVYLLKILDNLYKATTEAAKAQISELITPTIHFALEQALKYNNNAGFSVVYESIRVLIVVSQQNSSVLESAISNISVLLSHRFNNLRYLGINALSSIVRLSPRSVTGYQLEVIECLESRDETLKRKSLDLLYRMTNSKNVVPICAKLISHLMTDDSLLKRELVAKISDLAERYSPNDYWYVETMIRMLSVEGDLMSQDSGFNLIRLVAGGTGEEDNDDEDSKIKTHAARLCWSVFNDIQQQQQQQEMQQNVARINVNSLLLKVISWVLSEYCYLLTAAEGVSLENVINLLVDQMDKEYSGDVKSYILSGLTKLSSQAGKILPQVLMVAGRYSNSRSLSTQRKSLQLLELSKLSNTVLDEVLPVDAYCEDLDMSQLESMVIRYANTAVAKGSKRYVPKQSRQPTYPKSVNQLVDLPVVGVQPTPAQKKELNFEYPSPTTTYPSPKPTTSIPTPAPTPTVTDSSFATNFINSIFNFETSPTTNTNAPNVAPSTVQTSPTTQITSSEISNRGNPVVPKPDKVVWTKKGFIGHQTTPPVATTTPKPEQQPAPSPQQTSPLVSPVKKQQESAKVTVVQPSPETIKKEKMAKELFGGVSDDSSESESRVNRIHAKTSAKTTTKLSPSRFATGDDNEMLLNLNLGTTISPNTSTPSTKSPISTTTTTHQLLDLDSSTVPLVNTSPVHPELIGLLPATLILDTDHTASAISTISQSLREPLATQINPGSSFNIQNLNLTTLLRRYINNSNLDNIVNQQIYSDNNVVISTIKQFYNSQLHLLILLSNNQSTKSITNLNQVISGNDHLKLDYYGDSIVNIHSNSLSVDDLFPKLTVVEIIKIDLKKVGFGISINLNIDFKVDEHSKSIPTLSIPIEISDFLIPLEVSSASQFEQLWSTFSHEREIMVDSSLQQKSTQLLSYFVKGLHLYTVQPLDSNVNQEFLGATQLKVNSNIAGGGITLFKLGYSIGKLTITLKTNDKNYSDVITRHCYKIHNSSIITLNK